MIRRLLPLAACPVLLAVAGCLSPPSGDSPTPPPEPASTNPTLVVAHPLDVSALVARPCDALTASQATELGFPGQPRQFDSQFLGSGQCVWSAGAGDQQPVTLRVIAFTQPYLRPLEAPGLPPLTTVSGYPALVAPTSLPLPFCDIDVKTGPHHAVSVAYGAHGFEVDPTASCDAGVRVAEVILANLPPGPVPT